jgi:Zn finger protein HypA/HybF involved in hydrogenase expression
MKSQKHIKSRKKVTDKRSSINELHEKRMSDFEKYYSTLPKKEEELKKLDPKSPEYNKLNEEIIKMRNQTDLYKYLSDISTVFYKMAIEEEDKKEINVENNGVGVKKFVEVSQGSNKGYYLNEYLEACDKNYTVSNARLSRERLKNYIFCTTCKCNCIFNQVECNIVCPKCGTCREWQDPDMPQWSDEVEVSKAYRYKRLGYFIEHLSRFQAKECRLIPDDVISEILAELNKRRIRDPDKITVKVIKDILKKLDLNSYYDNINSIIRTISGRKAPVFPKELEEKLISMFMKTQEPFEKYKKLIPERNNYLSYPYVIRKLLQIVAEEEESPEILKFVEWFPLLKSRQKLWYQEKVWEKITEENNWTFHKSI